MNFFITCLFLIFPISSLIVRPFFLPLLLCCFIFLSILLVFSSCFFFFFLIVYHYFFSLFFFLIFISHCFSLLFLLLVFTPFLFFFNFLLTINILFYCTNDTSIVFLPFFILRHKLNFSFPTTTYLVCHFILFLNVVTIL